MGVGAMPDKNKKRFLYGFITWLFFGLATVNLCFVTGPLGFWLMVVCVFFILYFGMWKYTRTYK
jgi:hypothetical protein